MWDFAPELAIGNWQLAPHKFETLLTLLVRKAGCCSETGNMQFVDFLVLVTS